MRGCVHARRTLKGLIADLRINIFPRVIIGNDNLIFFFFLIEFPKNFVSLQWLYARLKKQLMAHIEKGETVMIIK